MVTYNVFMHHVIIFHEEGCIYSDAYSAYNGFDAVACSSYGGTPCTVDDVVGCMDANASNYNADATHKVMTNGVTYNVYTHHVMIFQSMDVFTLMASEHLMKSLMLLHVQLTEVLHVSLLLLVKAHY